MTPLLAALALAAGVEGSTLAELEVAPLLFLQGEARLVAAEVEGEPGFSLSRARAGLRVSPFPWVTGTWVFEAALEKPRLLDAFATVRPLSSWELSAGLAKTPLFASATEDDASLPISERPLLVTALWPGRDIGAALHFHPDRAPAEFWLRIGNGSQSVIGNDNAGIALDARVDIVLGRARGGAHEDDIVGLRIGVGTHAEDDAAEKAGIAGTTATGFTFYRPPPVVGPRSIFEAHLIGYAGPVRLVLEAATAQEARAIDTDGDPATARKPLAPIAAGGAVVELAWMITGERRAPGEWPGKNAAEGLGFLHVGSVELAARGERVSLGSDAADVVPGGAWGASGALNWWWTENVALSGQLHALQFDRGPIEEPDRTLSWTAQLRLTLNLR